MNTGLSEKDFAILREAILRHPEIEESIIFGSRAKGNYKPGSDIDIAIKGTNVTRRTAAALHSDLEDSYLPYFVDVVDYNTITNAALIDHIDRVGVRL